MSLQLKFQTKHVGYSLLKKEMLPTLLPISEIQKRKAKDSLIIDEVPIFLNNKTGQYTVFLPDQFLVDVTEKELKNKYSKFGKNPSIITDKNGACFLGLSFDSLDELRQMETNENGKLQELKKNYDNHILEIKNGEEVIVIGFKNKNSSGLSIPYGSKENILAALIGSRAQFEFFKAFKFNNKYYLINTGGELNQDIMKEINKNEQHNTNLLVIPYTEKDWEMVNKIYEKIMEINNTLINLFKEQYQPGLLDKPISEINSSLLEDLDGHKKLKM